MAIWDDDDYHEEVKKLDELEQNRYYHLYFKDKPKFNGFYEYMEKNNYDGIDNNNEYTFKSLEPKEPQSFVIPEEYIKQNIRIYPRQYKGIARGAKKTGSSATIRTRSRTRHLKRSVKRSRARSRARTRKRSRARSGRH